MATAAATGRQIMQGMDSSGILPHLPYTPPNADRKPLGVDVSPPNADRKPLGADAHAAECGSEASGCGYTRRQMRIGSLWVQMRMPPDAD